MIKPRIPKIFLSRKSSPPAETQVFDDDGSVYSQPTPIEEGSVYSQPTPVEEVLARNYHMSHDEPRPIPPPMEHDFRHDSEDFQEPGSRLFETLSTDDGHPRHVLALEAPHHDDHEHIATPRLPSSQAHDDDYDYEMASARPVRIERSRPIQVPPSTENSYSTRGGNNRVTFMGDLGHHDREDYHDDYHDDYQTGFHDDYHDDYDGYSAGRTMTSGFPGTVRSNDSSRTGSSSSTNRRRYDHRDDKRVTYRDQPRSRAGERIVEPKLPYMILVDWGNGLQCGNEEDGFMPYEEYLSTSHLRRYRGESYLIIPGNTPVVFHDEHGHELFRVDAQKYNTPYMRRRKYIIQDEYGNEIHRIGFDRDRKNAGSSGSRHSDSGSSGRGYGSPRSQDKRVIYLEPSLKGSSASSRTGSNYTGSSYTGSSYARTASSRASEDSVRTMTSSSSSKPDICVVDENGNRIYDTRDHRTTGMIGYNDHYDDDRSNNSFASEYGRTANKDKRYVDEFGMKKPSNKLQKRPPVFYF